MCLKVYRCNVSSIWECVNREEGTRQCVKIIDRRRFNSPEDEDSALKEIAMTTFLRSYDSNQLTRVVQVTEDLHHFYIAMELTEGTNLANYLQERSGDAMMTESSVQRLARSLLKAIRQLHDLGVCHYDLQPENILLEQNRDDQVVLCDFGSARFVNAEDDDLSQAASRHRRRRRRSLRSLLGGNLNYAAPEVLTKYNCVPTLASDMWSVGVILYQCLCGSLPFDDVTSWTSSTSNSSTSSSTSARGRLKENIVKANYNFCRKEWSFITRGAKQFVSSLLHPDPMVRMTVAEALVHPWLTTESPPLLVSPSPTESKRKRRSLVKRVLGTISKRTGSSPEKCDSELTTASTLSSVGSMEEATIRRHLYA
jgi:serine/threonine protein kinase